MVNSGATAPLSRGSTSGFGAGLELVENAATPHPGFLQTDSHSQSRDRSAIAEGSLAKPQKSLARFPHQRPSRSPAAAMLTEGKAFGCRRSPAPRPGANKSRRPAADRPICYLGSSNHCLRWRARDAAARQPRRSDALAGGAQPARVELLCLVLKRPRVAVGSTCNPAGH